MITSALSSNLYNQKVEICPKNNDSHKKRPETCGISLQHHIFVIFTRIVF